MDNIVHIHDGDFEAVIYLDKLGELPRSNYRKLLRIMRSDPRARVCLDKYLQELVQTTEAAWKQASQDYADGWRHVLNPKSRKPEVRAVLQENARLKNAVKHTKGAHDNAVCLWQISNE